jgi:hypothetical protein
VRARGGGKFAHHLRLEIEFRVEIAQSCHAIATKLISGLKVGFVTVVLHDDLLEVQERVANENVLLKVAHACIDPLDPVLVLLFETAVVQHRHVRAPRNLCSAV